MTAGGHFVFSLANVIFAKKLNLSSELAQGNWIHIIFGGTLTCLLPDIDHPRSLLGRRLTWISQIILKFFGHRSITHSYFAIYGCNIILFSDLLSHIHIPLDFIHAMFIGYTSHIIADILTPKGVRLLWPCSWHFYLPILNPNKYPTWEKIFCIIVLLCGCIYSSDIKGSIIYLFIDYFNYIDFKI